MKQHDGNPPYPDLGAGVAKYRRMARDGGVQQLPEAIRWAYGEAIEKAIRAMQRSELQRELPNHACGCASGCSKPDGIGDHMRQKQRSDLLAYPGKVRRHRTSEQWQALYDAAMAEKRKRKPQRRSIAA